jgi:hypothetical protein
VILLVVCMVWWYVLEKSMFGHAVNLNRIP